MNKRLVRFAMSLPGLFLPLINRTNGTLVSMGRERSYLLHIPDTYQPGDLASLVISLHGFSEWPAHQMHISHWNDLARQHGFLVVYPCGTQVPLRWHTFGWADSEADQAMDVTFISDLIDKLKSEYNLDPAKIYINGFSNGGGMAFVLACKLSERIAAIGCVSGAYPFTPDECHSSRAVPTIIFHGTKDPIVPFLGGGSNASRFSLPSIPQWVAALAQKNGCRDTPLEIPATGDVSGIHYTNHTGNGDVVFYTIAGGGHSWPGGGSLPRIIVGNTNRDIDATKIMWDFFQMHSRTGK